MKKWMLAMLVMVLVIGSVSAEWKDYEWGMSPEEVQAVEDLPWLFGDEDGNLAMDMYTTTVMDYLTGASFMFENNQLKAIMLEVEGDIFEQAVDTYRERYGRPSSEDFAYMAWDDGDTLVTVETNFVITQITYLERNFARRMMEQRFRRAEDEL